ncbi:hypothetical protein ABH935_003459 [Catenulispora sp. GAS73]|uniref:NlpC/P60 family protein n=1 Tax=Catenulispora sp. GAS73 TaxID=3156269 RepID=UPI003514C332
MPRISAEMIYAVARQAGFSPDQSATMTAVALAESGGNTGSHNPVNEDSRGLWQINALAHPDLLARFPNLYDPVQNAKAAFLVSNGGKDMSPWTTTHGGAAARYLRYRTDAEQAAIAYGDGPGHGVWTGTAAYGDHESAGSATGGGAGIHAVADPTGSVSAGGQVTMTGAPTTEDQAIAPPPTTTANTANTAAPNAAANPDAANSTSAADGSNAVTVANAAATPDSSLGAASGHDTRPGADYGIPLAAPATASGTTTGTGTGTGPQTLDAPGHTATAGGDVRLGADYGIPLAGSTPAAAATPTAPATPTTPTTPTQPTTPVTPTAPDSSTTHASDHTVAPPVPTIPSPATQSADSERLQEFLHAAVAQTGDQYIYGANADFNNPHPSAFDCSDLVQWATHRVGISMPRTASEQYEFLKHGGHVIPVDQAVHTPGALLFNFSSNPDDGQPAHGHVAISLGDGKTMEALGPAYGVGSWNANTTRFNYAAVIPGLSPGTPTAAAPATAASGTPAAAAPADTHQADAHQQTTGSLVDDFEARLAADPHAMDTHASVLDASQQMTAAPNVSTPAAPAADHATDIAADHSADHGSADHHLDTDHHGGADGTDHHDTTDHDSTDHTAADAVDHTDPALASAMLWYPEPDQHADHHVDHGDVHDAGIH